MVHPGRHIPGSEEGWFYYGSVEIIRFSGPFCVASMIMNNSPISQRVQETVFMVRSLPVSVVGYLFSNIIEDIKDMRGAI